MIKTKQQARKDAYIASAGAFIAGLLILLMVDYYPQSWPLWVRRIIESTGTVLSGVGVIGFIWEFVSAESFARRLFSDANVAGDVDSIKLRRIFIGRTPDFTTARNIPWREMFGSTDWLDVCFAYGQTWRNTWDAELSALPHRGCRTRCFVPDSTNDALISQLSSAFGGMAAERLRENIENTVRHFQEIYASHPDLLTVVRIPVLHYSAYRTSTQCVFVPMSMRREKSEFVALVGDRGGELDSFLKEELDALDA